MAHVIAHYCAAAKQFVAEEERKRQELKGVVLSDFEMKATLGTPLRSAIALTSVTFTVVSTPHSSVNGLQPCDCVMISSYAVCTPRSHG